MKDINAALLAHLRSRQLTLAICWVIQKRDGGYIRGTNHDRNIVISPTSPSTIFEGTYRANSSITASDIRSTSDMSVDNMEVNGAIDDVYQIDVNVADIESGNLDGAEVYAFGVNWQNPDMGRIPLRRGFIGEILRDSDGRYQTEIRGLKQKLKQRFVNTYGTSCSVKQFGDTQCGFNREPFKITGTVSAVTNRKVFTITGITSQAVGYFNYGEVIGLTGENAGYRNKVKLDNYGGTHGRIELMDAFFYDIAVGNTFTFYPGCNKQFSDCQRHGNQARFRGYGLGIPGALALMKGPT